MFFAGVIGHIYLKHKKSAKLSESSVRSANEDDNLRDNLLLVSQNDDLSEIASAWIHNLKFAENLISKDILGASYYHITNYAPEDITKFLEFAPIPSSGEGYLNDPGETHNWLLGLKNDYANLKITEDLISKNFGGSYFHRKGFYVAPSWGREYDVEIEDIAKLGDGIARIEGFVIFVPDQKFSLPINRLWLREAVSRLSHSGQD